MNQQKIGAFLKELRKQKGLTQAQLAETVNVSNRTVSRWENGNNMPDLDILIQISDYFEIELRELLDGERKSGEMKKEMEETVLKAVDYTNTETEKYTKKVHGLFFVGAIFWFLTEIINHAGFSGMDAWGAVSDVLEGATCGVILTGFIITSRYGQKIKAFKQRALRRQ